MIAKLNSDSFSIKFLLSLIALGISLFTVLLMTTIGIEIGFLVILSLALIPFIFLSIKDPFYGLYLLTFYAFFLFYIGRFLPSSLPLGAGFDLIIALVFAGVLLNGKVREFKGFKNTITIVFIVWSVYGVLQVGNPNAVSLTAWLHYFRFLIFNAALFFILTILLDSQRAINDFTKLWLLFAVLAALYSIYQEIFGYTDLEWRLINEVPRLRELIQNGSVIRKFSFFSDVATFGMFMAFSAIFSIVFALDHKAIKVKMIFSFLSFIFLLGIVFSGTRTAMAMVPIGLFFYGLISINRVRTLVVGVLSVLALAVFLFGPFYSTTAIRMRSTFSPNEDSSMVLRDINRKLIQPYIHSHPIGGGVFTTGGAGEDKSPGHRLAGFPPDSGYLQTALELGWIGLIIELLLYYFVLIVGIKNFYLLKPSRAKVLYAAYLSSFFSLCVANYTQLVMPQKPINLIIFALFAIVPNLIRFTPKNIHIKE